MKIEHFFDPDTSTFTYIVIDEQSKHCAVIDPVLDINMASGQTSHQSVDKLIDYINSNQLKLEWILETHAHADHISGAYTLKQKIGGKIAIGEHILQVQEFWQAFYGMILPQQQKMFDHLFKDGEVFQIGELNVQVMATPGHTPACICYQIEDSVFVGDTVFMPALGTARADFPGGSAEQLYQSIQKIFSLPDTTKVYVGHDYPKDGEVALCQTTVAEQKSKNIMINHKITKEEYIAKRQARDKSLAVPRLLLPAIQVNIQAGKFIKDETGQDFIKIPVNKL